MSTESTYTVGEGYVPDVGGHSTGGAIAAAAQAANAAAAQVREEAAKIETAAKDAIAKETDPQARMAAADAEGLTQSSGRTIDLGTDKGMRELNGEMSARATGIEQHAKDMSKATPGVYRNVPAGGVITTTTLEDTSNKLSGDNVSIKAKDGNLKGGTSLSDKTGISGQKHAPGLTGPRLAAAPTGPGGMGGGAAMMARRQTINPIRANEKIARINGESAKRDPNTPADMSRHDHNALKYQDRQGEDTLKQQERFMPKTPASAAMHNPMFSMNMTMAPKGPTWSGGEKMGTTTTEDGTA